MWLVVAVLDNVDVEHDCRHIIVFYLTELIYDIPTGEGRARKNGFLTSYFRLSAHLKVEKDRVADIYLASIIYLLFLHARKCTY